MQAAADPSTKFSRPEKFKQDVEEDGLVIQTTNREKKEKRRENKEYREGLENLQGPDSSSQESVKISET